MVELVDTLASGASDSNIMGVRVSPKAPENNRISMLSMVGIIFNTDSERFDSFPIEHNVHIYHRGRWKPETLFSGVIFGL